LKLRNRRAPECDNDLGSLDLAAQIRQLGILPLKGGVSFRHFVGLIGDVQDTEAEDCPREGP
jgi:hypothetical protein